MKVGWREKTPSRLFLQSHIISHYGAEEDRGNKKVWIPIPQCHPSPSGSMQDEDQIVTITVFNFFSPYTKSLERHRHSFTEALAPEGYSDSTPDTCLKPLSFFPQLWSCGGKLCVLHRRGQDTAPDPFALLMDSFTPYFHLLHLPFPFFFLMWQALLETRYWAIHNKKRYPLAVPP